MMKQVFDIAIGKESVKNNAAGIIQFSTSLEYKLFDLADWSRTGMATCQQASD